MNCSLGLASLAALAVACSSGAPSPSSAEEPAKPPAAPRRVDPPAAVGSLGGYLAADGEALMATWLEPAAPGTKPKGSTRRGPHRVQFARFEAGAWSKPVTIAEGEGVFANWADVPSVARGGDGVLVAHWAQRSEGGPYSYDVALARSTDAGATWTPLGLAHDDGTATEHGFVSLVAEAGGVRAFWLDGRETAGGDHGGHGSGPMTLRTALVGETVTGGEVVDPRVCDCCGTAAIETGDGVAIVYRDRSQDEVRDIWIARRAAGAWAEPVAVHADGWRIPGCPVNGPAIAADGAHLAVAWHTYANDRSSVRIAFSADGGASFAAPIEVDGPRGRRSPVGRVGLVLVSPNEAIVSWIASDREQAAIYLRRILSDGRVGAEIEATATSPARDAGFPRIARVGQSIALLWTEAGKRSRVRFKEIPLAAIADATSKPAVAEDPTDALLALGSTAPSLDLDKLDGSRGSLADLKGQVTLVNLWATWCEPCRHEMPVLAALQRKHVDTGFRIVAISVDRDRTPGELREFSERRDLPFAIWHDPKDLTSAAFGVGALPASFLFGADGRLVWRRAGAVKGDDRSLERALTDALGATATR